MVVEVAATVTHVEPMSLMASILMNQQKLRQCAILLISIASPLSQQAISVLQMYHSYLTTIARCSSC